MLIKNCGCVCEALVDKNKIEASFMCILLRIKVDHARKHARTQIQSRAEGEREKKKEKGREFNM